MLPLRLHPEADAEAIEAATYIKADDPVQGALFVEAWSLPSQQREPSPNSIRVSTENSASFASESSATLSLTG